ncbi:MAG: hypothetical protein AB7H88_04165 [Vicinamibacterales bacterium]
MNQVPPRLLRTALVTGGVLGVLSMASPLTVVFAIAMVALVWGSTRGLEPRERAWMRGATAVAVGLRLAAVAALPFMVDESTGGYAGFFGDGLYSITRSLWLRNSALGIPIAPEYFIHAFDPYGRTGYHYVLAAIQILVGPAPIALHLASIFFFFAALFVLHGVVRRSYGAPAALATFLLLAFLPSWFAWSVAVLKESFHFLLMAVILAGTLVVVRSPSWRYRVLAGLAVIASMALVDTLRSGALAIVVVGIAIGVVARLAFSRTAVFVPAVALLAVLSVLALRSPAVQTRLLGEFQMAANRHIGQVMSAGQSFKLLDDRFYFEGAGSAFTMTPEEELRFAVRSAVAFFLVPLPWEIGSLSLLAYLPQQMLWYGLVIFACYGLAAAWRRDPLVTGIIGGYLAMGVAVIMPNSGNIGTLIRHRDLILPFVACVGVIGLLNAAARVVGQARAATGDAATSHVAAQEAAGHHASD